MIFGGKPRGGGGGGSSIAGDGVVIRVSANDMFGANAAYIEGADANGDVMLVLPKGFSIWSHAEQDGMGSWSPSIQLNNNGVVIGDNSNPPGMGTVINGGEFGIVFSPGEGPFEINGRGSVSYVDPGIGAPVTPTQQGIRGAIGFFDGYIYICVETNTWVRTAAQVNW
jgi:hypothetical protein